MKRLLSLALTAALALELVACSGQSQTADTPETAATPQAVETAETAAIPVAGDFYAIQPVIGMNTLFNAGDVFYELRPRSGYCLLFRIDCDTATRGVLCSVPGCTTIPMPARPGCGADLGLHHLCHRGYRLCLQSPLVRGGHGLGQLL